MARLSINGSNEEIAKLTDTILTNGVGNITIETSKDEYSRMTGNQLRSIRENELHMTQERFSDEVVAIHQSVLSRMERGIKKVSRMVADAALAALAAKEKKSKK